MDMPISIKKANDPAEIVEINARMFTVQEFYMDKMIENFRRQEGLELSSQDKELLLEALEQQGTQKP